MKTTLSILLVLVVIACSKKETASDEWPGMDTFHMVMAEAYHPLKDSANLAPAKANAEDLAMEAENWEKGDLPEKVDNDEVKAMLSQLKTDSRAFADQVKSNAPDSVLAGSLENLHGEFHKIMEAWNGGGEKHEH
ncbi:MAG TPA: hypothetical protein PLR06_06640 [Cyclobacteriaceae bacterium]|nr:hypothetical protein [Cyclobacteriaceae bacterium]